MKPLRTLFRSLVGDRDAAGGSEKHEASGISLRYDGKPVQSSSSISQESKIRKDREDPACAGISLDHPEGDKERRQSLRVSGKGLTCACKELKARLKVKDISGGGIALFFEGPRIKSGAHLTVTLLVGDRILVKSITIRAIHHGRGLLGCAFEGLNEQAEDAICRYLLLVQKRQLEKKRVGDDASQTERRPT